MLYVSYAQVFVKHKKALNNSFLWQRGWSMVTQGRELKTWRFNFLTMRATQEGMSWLVKYWLPWPWNYARRGWISLCPVGVSCIRCCGGVGLGLCVSDSVQPHRRQPTRLPRPWDSPGKNTGVGCHCLLQCLKVKSESEVAQSCPTLSDPMNCGLPGSSVHGIFQVRVLKWVAIAFSDVDLDA